MSDTTAQGEMVGGTPPEVGPPGSWWRRRPVLVSLVVVVVLVATILTDLPQSATPAVQYGTDVQVLRQINSDVAPCSYAVGEAFMIHRRQLAGTLTASERAEVPKLLTDDQMACSFTSQSVFDLSNVEVPGSTSGRYLQNLVGTATTWVTSDSLRAIEAIQSLWGNRHDAAALRKLARAEQLMSEDRALALRDMAGADHVVKRKLPRLKLTAVPA